VVTVVLFSFTHFLDDLGVELGPEVVRDRVLILHVIVAQDSPLVQFVECADDLLKGAVNDATRLVNIGFGFMQFHFVRFHSLYPIGNHVAQRIQAFLGNGKRGYLRSIWKEITAVKEKQGLEPIRYGRTHGNWQTPFVESRNGEEGSGVANARNPGKEFWAVPAAVIEQSLENVLKTVLSVSRSEMLCQESEWKAGRAEKNKKREPKASASGKGPWVAVSVRYAQRQSGSILLELTHS